MGARTFISTLARLRIPGITVDTAGFESTKRSAVGGRAAAICASLRPASAALSVVVIALAFVSASSFLAKCVGEDREFLVDLFQPRLVGVSEAMSCWKGPLLYSRWQTSLRLPARAGAKIKSGPDETLEAARRGAKEGVIDAINTSRPLVDVSPPAIRSPKRKVDPAKVGL